MSPDKAMLWVALQEQASELQLKYPAWRRGQALFNALYEVHPELADRVRMTEADPFFDDAKIEAFGQVVMRGVFPDEQGMKADE